MTPVRTLSERVAGSRPVAVLIGPASLIKMSGRAQAPRDRALRRASSRCGCASAIMNLLTPHAH